MSSYTGTIGDDTQVGSTGEDTFDYSQGGHDTLFGGDDDDFFVMGAALDAQDVIDGGDQVNLDSVEISGDYSAGLTITSSMLVGIEGLGLGAGTYRVFLGDGVANGYFPIGFQSGATGVFDASASSTMISPTLNPGVHMRVIGGAGDDQFDIDSGERGNVLVGGSGSDTLRVQNLGDVRFAGHSFSGFETLHIDHVDGRVVLADANVAAGDTLQVEGGFTFGFDVDGHREADGHLSVVGTGAADTVAGGHLADSIDGGDGADSLAGGGGADRLTGGAGADVFSYGHVRESWRGAADLITDLDGSDLIDLSRIDADTTQGGVQHFNLVAAFDGHAGQLTLAYDAEAGLTRLQGDVDGDGRAEFLVLIDGDHADFTGFILGGA